MKWIKACSGAGAVLGAKRGSWPARLLASGAMALAAWWSLAMCSELTGWPLWAVGLPFAAWGLLLSLPVLCEGWKDGWLEDYLRGAPFVWLRTLTNDGKDGRLWHAMVWSCTWPAEVAVCAGTLIAVCIHCVVVPLLRLAGRILNTRLLGAAKGGRP